jgi:DNA-binding response OmpR family regulator
VIVCDADEVAAHLLRRLLERDGYLVSVCATAAECKRLVSLEQPTLTSLAILLPDQDGLSLLRDLRRTYPTIQVIVVSALHAEQSALELGARRFIAKPITASRLLDVVQEIASSPATGAVSAAAS